MTRTNLLIKKRVRVLLLHFYHFQGKIDIYKAYYFLNYGRYKFYKQSSENSYAGAEHGSRYGATAY